MPDFLPRALELRGTTMHERSRTTMRELTVDEMVDTLCDGHPPAGLADAVAATVHETFVNVARFPDGLKDLLARLGRDRPLAVLSNFFMTSPIDAALERRGPHRVLRAHRGLRDARTHEAAPGALRDRAREAGHGDGEDAHGGRRLLGGHRGRPPRGPSHRALPAAPPGPDERRARARNPGGPDPQAAR